MPSTFDSSFDASQNRTYCELNGELIEETSTVCEYLVSQIASLPNVHITSESLLQSAVTGESARSAFLEQSETLLQKIQAAWYGHGLIGVLTEVCDGESNEEVSPYVKRAGHCLLVALRWISGMRLTLFPHLKLTNDQLISTFSENSDWLGSPIRYLSWHSDADKFALALMDDTVKIYYSNNDLVPLLKHKLQRNVTAMSWKPLSATVLAVGTQTAILIWNVDPCSLSTRPSAGTVQVLSYAGHSPVTSLEWNPNGLDLLFTVSALNSALVVWNVSLKQHQVIQHVSTCGGISRLMFSPEGSKMLACTPSSSFRVFETATWTNERWSKLTGRVQTSCWNPDGTILLFALVNDSRIYSLSFANSRSFDKPVVDGSKHASVLVELANGLPNEEASAESQSNNCIHSMVMDNTGERLAVMFNKDDPRSHLVAMYTVTSEPVFSATSSGFIRGEGDATPRFITFKPKFDKGALLTICYSNGQVCYIPMYFKASSTPYTPNTFTSPLSFSKNTLLESGNPSIWSSSVNNSVLLS